MAEAVSSSIQEISRTENLLHFDWNIRGFSHEHLRRTKWVFCPSFSFAGWEWFCALGLENPGQITSRVVFCIFRGSGRPTPVAFVHYWVGTRTRDSEEEVQIGKGKVDPMLYRYFQRVFWLPLCDLHVRRICSRRSGAISIIARFTIELVTGREMKSVKTEQSTQTDLEDISFLIEQSRKYLLHSSDHDVLFKVKDKEFKAHKSVLQSRSPVFKAMFQHEMRENVEDTVTIEDVDPDCFGMFVDYMYTGQVENLLAANALGLYYLGDKYDFPSLKRRCVDVLKASLSISLVCDIITLAGTHGEEELLESAMAYVTGHLEELMETSEWQQFVLSNPLQAKEISSKAGKRLRTSDIQE